MLKFAEYLPARQPPGIQVQVFYQRVEVHAVRLRAEAGRIALVFDAENRLAGLDEWQQQIALIILETLLVELPIEIVNEIGNLGEIIFQARPPAGGCGPG